MQNIGKVNIYGADVAFDACFKVNTKYRFFVNATYSFQKALDMTSQSDPTYSKVYKHQIPYTPKHSGGGVFTFENPYFDLSYSVIYSGARYVLGQNISENYLEPYSDQSISFGKEIKWGTVVLAGKFEILNLFDKQYEVVRYFPMQGRSYRVLLKISLPK